MMKAYWKVSPVRKREATMKTVQAVTIQEEWMSAAEAATVWKQAERL